MATDYHEPADELSEEARDIHRMLATLIEELEAVDWYYQRVDRSSDESLKEVIRHHLDEEVEHAAMSLEWLRRKMPIFDEELRTYLFTEQPITGVEESEEDVESGGSAVEQRADLGIGSMKKGE